MSVLCLATAAIIAGCSLGAESQAQNAAPDNAELLKQGAEIFKARCSLCHLPEGQSPNKRMRLNDKAWEHGGKPEEIRKVVIEGVKGTAMMGFKNRLKEDQINAVTAYVLTLSEEKKP